MDEILKDDIQKFIDDNIGADVSKLALQKNPFPYANWIEIINQISAKTKAKTKLPTWFSAKNIIYPAKISVEQTSSEKTARYKSEIVSGEHLIDLSGGFGVDDFYFSKKITNVVHCEINCGLSDIAIHNFKQLSVQNVECICGDSTKILTSTLRNFDWIYVDPSRRSDVKGKVFLLKDCVPNVPELLNLYFEHAHNILIKTAPILDISAGLSELKHVKRIYIVAVENEVKELLWELSHGYSGDIEIKTANLLSDKTDAFSYTWGESGQAAISLPKKYIYEPNGAIMKSGGFESVGLQFGVEKLQRHSHLYTSEVLLEFPGRTFEVREILPYEKSHLKNLKDLKMNVTVRNFPLSVDEIRKKWKIKDGGTDYCFFTTDLNNHKIALLCTKI